jgi:hypothetical protein
VDEFGGSGGSPGGEVLALHEANPKPTGGGIERCAASSCSAADDEHVKGLRGRGPGQRRALRVARGRRDPRLCHALPRGVEGRGGGFGGGSEGHGNGGGGGEGGARTAEAPRGHGGARTAGRVGLLCSVGITGGGGEERKSRLGLVRGRRTCLNGEFLQVGRRGAF